MKKVIILFLILCILISFLETIVCAIDDTNYIEDISENQNLITSEVNSLSPSSTVIKENTKIDIDDFLTATNILNIILITIGIIIILLSIAILNRCKKIS